MAPSCFVLEFRCREIAAAARAGQFLMLSASDAIDPLLRRPMAVYQILRDDEGPVGFSVLVERTGRGTTLMAEWRPGAGVDVLGPLGVGFSVPDDPEATAVLVMGGVGAAPFPLLAEQLLAAGRETVAFIGGRDADHLFCADDFADLGVSAHLATEDGSVGVRGLVTEALVDYLDSSSKPCVLYSCGPTPMMGAVQAIAAGRGLGHTVSLEAPMACGIGICLSCVVPVADPERGWRYQRTCREGPVFDAATLLWERPR